MLAQLKIAIHLYANKIGGETLKKVRLVCPCIPPFIFRLVPEFPIRGVKKNNTINPDDNKGLKGELEKAQQNDVLLATKIEEN